MATNRRWASAEQLREEFGPWLSDWMLKKLRRERIVSYLKVGHKTILYDADKVARALAKLEIQEVS